MAIDGKKLNELVELVLSAYRAPDLEEMLHTRLDLPMYALVPRGLSDSETVYKLLVELGNRGRIADFVAAMKETRPNRPDIQSYPFTDLAEAPSRTNALPRSEIPDAEPFINAMCQLTPSQFDSILLFLGIPKADVGGADLRGRAVSVYEHVARPGANRERNLLRLKSEIERLYPDAFTSGAGG